MGGLFDVPRNDEAAAKRWYEAQVQTGEPPTSDDVHVLLMLQDDPEALRQWVLEQQSKAQ